MKLIVENLAKDYLSFASFGERAAAALTLGLFGPSLRFQALSDINLECGEKGEIIGIIGPNGAGKSTLLRILSGISPPSSGRIHFTGSIRSILELGVGFNPDLTALENVYYNGRLWGYPGRKLLSRADEIFEFAELSDYRNQQIKTFSTGMQMRLGFALAAFERSDLLLVDEALAVGDASFQQKCLRRFQDYRNQGSVIIVVSHDTHLLQAVCDRIMLLDRGRILEFGEPRIAVEKYMHLIAERSFKQDQAYTLLESEFSISLLDSTGRPRSIFFAGESAMLRISLNLDALRQVTPGKPKELKETTVGIHINDSRGIRAFGTNTHILGGGPVELHSGKKTTVEFSLTLNLGPGRYSAGFSVHRGRSHASDCFLWRESILDFEMEAGSGQLFEGISFLDPHARIIHAEGAE